LVPSTAYPSPPYTGETSSQFAVQPDPSGEMNVMLLTAPAPAKLAYGTWVAKVALETRVMEIAATKRVFRDVIV
jgi:hypothetical protein